MGSKIDKAFCRYPISFLSLYQNRPLYYWQTGTNFCLCLYSDWSRPRSTGNGVYLALAGDFVTKIAFFAILRKLIFHFCEKFFVVCKGDFCIFAFLCETEVKIFRDFFEKSRKIRKIPTLSMISSKNWSIFRHEKSSIFQKGRAFARFLKIFKNSTTWRFRSD